MIPPPPQLCPHCGVRCDHGVTRCAGCGKPVPAWKPRNVRWRRGYEPAPRPATGLRGTLIRLFGGRVPAWPPPKPIASSSEPDSLELPEPRRIPASPRPSLELPPTDGDLAPTQALPPTGVPLDLPSPREQTVAAFGIDMGKLKLPRHQYVLQVYDSSGRWRDWGSISSQGLRVGRASETEGLPALMSLARRHMRLSYQDADLIVEDLGSINGIYLKLQKPAPLEEGTRFRIGGYLFSFHLAPNLAPSVPLVADDGEEFCARDPVALAFLDVIGADNSPKLRIPLLRADSTIIGRESAEANLAFKDGAISARHAEIRKQEAGFFLEDLKSRNGTYLKLTDRSVISAGDVLLVGQMLFRIHDPS